MIDCDPDSINRPDPCALVLFGATGDLAHRKLVPALYSLFTQKLLPDRFAIVAFARRPFDDATYRDDLRKAVKDFNPDLPVDSDGWTDFANRIVYHRGNLDEPADFVALKKRLEALDSEAGLKGNRLYYLATPPDHFADIAKQLHESGLA